MTFDLSGDFTFENRFDRTLPPITPASPASRPADDGHDAGSRPVAPVRFSFVVPVKDEEATLAELYRRIAEQLGEDELFEVIFIDDGSSDGSWAAIGRLVHAHPGRVRGLRFRRNTGKAAALTAGFRAARGSIIFTLDADLQDDPKEIHRFLAKLNEGYDLVSGWKKVRHDPWHKVLPSRVFNRMLSKVTGVHLHDHNCGFKCYRAEVAKAITLHGELHRMVPALAAIEGFRAAEIVVEHHPRRHGVSKYGFERYLRGFVDMLTVGFLRKYRHRPSHFIAGVSAACGALALGLIGSGVAMMLLQAAMAGVAAIAAGSALLAAAVIGSFCCLLAELANRGGLWSSFRLPIVEDTAGAGSPMTAQFPAAAPVEMGFATLG